jgi:hypothetical protein
MPAEGRVDLLTRHCAGADVPGDVGEALSADLAWARASIGTFGRSARRRDSFRAMSLDPHAANLASSNRERPQQQIHAAKG